MKKNIVVIDFEPTAKWPFIDVLQQEMGLEWIEKKCVSNQFRMGKLDNLKRYYRYFSFSLKIFCEREKYGVIVGWQQFYGIFFAFFSRLLHVKKKNPLFIMTFIYKPKKGFVGKLYRWFIKYSIETEYVDKVICFSSTEPQHYSELFSIPLEKFEYVPLGEDLEMDFCDQTGNRHGVVSLGLSNRDYGFLVRVFMQLPYDLKIYADHDEIIAPNITMSGEMVGNRIGEVLNSTELLVIPLQDVNISAGQLTALHAMQLGIPVIATDSDGIKDFIINGENGFLVKNEVSEWKEKITELLSDKNRWKTMSDKTVEIYTNNHTVSSMAKNIAKIINEKLLLLENCYEKSSVN